MSWEERLKPAAYTSPSGERLPFFYGDVGEDQERLGSAWTFPDTDGTFIQDLGNSGRRYPLKCTFWGEDCDKEAEAFQEALREHGVGVLEHPVYGRRDVVPFGTFGRKDPLVTARNQVVINVVFWETTGVLFPSSRLDPASEVINAVGEYNQSAATEFQEVTSLDGAVQKATFKSRYDTNLDRMRNGLKKIAEVQENTRKQFNAVVDSINQGIDVLIQDPLTLAFETSIAIQAPARAASAIGDRLAAYQDLAAAIIGGNDSVVPSKSKTHSNRFHGDELFATGFVTGTILSIINAEFVTKADALLAAETMLALFEDVSVWRDDNLTVLEEVDPGGAYQKLQSASALAAGFLVDISFSLKQERVIQLVKPHTIIDLVAKLNGAVDSELDFFISSNRLTGDEILELPRNKKLVHYV